MPINDITIPSKSSGVSEQPTVGINPRLTFGFLLGLSVITLGLGFWQIGRAIKAPFERTVAQDNPSGDVGANSVRPLQEDSQTLVELRSKDTDRDGLNDYDELYVYRSSPYLPDTDSDGFTDGEEVKKNYDPNCPAGQDCRGLATDTGQTDTAASGETIQNTDSLVNPLGSDYSTLLEQLQSGQQGVTTVDPAAQAAQMLSTMTADQLRQILKDSGQVDEAELNAIDDETLMRVFQETLQQQQQQ